MRLDRISLKDHPPIKVFEIEITSNVVIIAGANGSGKTRLKDALVETFRSPNNPRASMTITATRDKEEAAWSAKSIQITAGEDCLPLRTYLSTRTAGQTYTGTIVQIDSNRAVLPVKFQQWTLATVDPDEVDINYSYLLSNFIDRWPQLVNKIYQKAAVRDLKIAKYAKDDPLKLCEDALAAHPNHFLPYQDIFKKLLPGKTLEPIDPKSPREFHYRIAGSDPMPFTSLSSGEQEVVKVACDLVWKKITHSIILFDEPELHLHPTLVFRLIETLKDLGDGTNQIILFTHSADLISTYYSSGNVFFIDFSQDTPNQAHQLSALSDQHGEVARAAGANLGLFAVGKQIVFVEGRDSSVDRLVYHKVAQSAFPDSYVMPIGSVANIVALRSVVDELANVIFGIDLFLIRDRDGLSDETICTFESNVRFRCLPRRHIENYLLDAEVLSAVAKNFYLSLEKIEISRIHEALHAIASKSLMQGVLWNIQEYIRALGMVSQPSVRDVGSMSRDELAECISKELTNGLGDISKNLEPSKISKLARIIHDRP